MNNCSLKKNTKTAVDKYGYGKGYTALANETSKKLRKKCK